MSPFIIHSIILVISGIITVFISARIAKTHKKTSYALMIIIPLCALAGSMAVLSPVNMPETKFEDLPPEAQKDVQKYIDNMNISDHIDLPETNLSK